jgi:hypothetical protein
MLFFIHGTPLISMPSSRAEEEDPRTLRQRLDLDPRNLDLANRYWNALGTHKGHDVRSGALVIETFCSVALDSREGIVALARAYQELFLNSGESPRIELFDEELITALRRCDPELPESVRSEVQWILRSIT